jgi:L-alanine-DL-glutamate epimerase-like enolase superfamily enzyme
MPEKVIIKEVALYKLRIPLIEPFITSLARETHVGNVIVTIKTSQDITGFGECSPYMPVNGESMDTCFMVGQYFGKLLKEKDALDIEGCLQSMDRLIYGNSSIKSAFDMALHDIKGQHAGLPIYKLFGGKNEKVLVTDYTVSLDDPRKMAADAVKIKNAGYPSIKVKLGESRKKDVERISMIREAVGNDIPICIDANQGWNVKTAIKTLQELEQFKVEHCEEPIPKWDFMNLKKIKKKTSIAIMADESCGDHHDAERLIKLKACDMFNIKIGKTGGLVNAWKIVQLAEEANIFCQVGAFMESRLGMTASAHLALCSPIIHYCDFDTPLMHAEDVVTGGLTYHANGVIKVPDEPGLGASINAGKLNEMEKIII